MILLNILFFIISCAVLVKSADFLLKSLIKISSFLKVHEFTIGFILMSVSTSLPELSVGIISGINKEPSLALGTAIGSIIINLTLVIGIVTLLARKIKIRSSIVRKDLVYMVMIAASPVILMVDHLVWNFFGIDAVPGLSRVDGITLLMIFALYMLNILVQEKKVHSKANKDRISKKEVFKHILFFLGSLVLLLISAQYTVEYAGNISLDLGISRLMMGLLIVALGTSLPELVFQLNAVMRHYEDMAIGDLIGSVINNATLVLGVTAIIHPITGNLAMFISSSLFMMIVTFIFLTFAESGKELTWREGMSLIFLYLFFIMGELFLRNVKF
ncbi:MAG: calcium/sodium antiporter [Nanoarchaeota archaeon]|nr:calcium/sodium antiporter [Nanoarchaeota archaeon]